MTGIVPDLSTDHPGPVAFAEVGLMPVEAQYGPVQADVSYVKVTLDNGTVLTLHPVTAHGVRVVAFATPANAMIVSATAYSRHGEIATAIPFNEPGGQAFFGIWLKPGQHGIARASGSIGSGTAGGNTWSAFAYLGPWGVCVVSVTGPICAATSASDLGTEVMASTESSTPEVVTGVLLSVGGPHRRAPARRHRDPGPAGDDRRPEVLRVLGDQRYSGVQLDGIRQLRGRGQIVAGLDRGRGRLSLAAENGSTSRRRACDRDRSWRTGTKPRCGRTTRAARNVTGPRNCLGSARICWPPGSAPSAVTPGQLALVTGNGRLRGAGVPGQPRTR
jgi:hypothetical protein